MRYNPADYIDLDVSERLRKLLPLITEFEPEEIELAAPLKPFIPDFIPARGGADDFIKVWPMSTEQQLLLLQQVCTGVDRAAFPAGWYLES